MRVLVTGGAGFIGSHVVEALRDAGHDPHVVDDLRSGSLKYLPTDVPLHRVDIRDAAALGEAFETVRPEAVSHHAAQVSVSRSVREPAADAEVNILGMLNVIEQAHRVGVDRFVFASSGGALYGETSVAADETTPATPISPYGIGKWMGELYLRWAARELGIAAVSLRYSNVYGPRQSLEGEAGVVAAFCRDLATGTPLTIFGDGRQTRDLVFVTDVARANVAALQQAAPGECLVVNISCGASIEINRLATELTAVCGAGTVEGPRWEPARPGDIRHSLLDPGLAADVLGWKPAVSLREGLEQTAAWFAESMS